MDIDNDDGTVVEQDDDMLAEEAVTNIGKSVGIVEQLETFGDYELQRLLGEGAFAKVYLAKDTLDRLVALKILKKQYSFDDVFVRNFRKEASMAARLNHENIIQIYAQDEIDGQFFIAMEYAPAGNLRDYMGEQGKISHAELKTFVQQIANALDVAHQDNVVHRDVKPSNILLSYNNRIKLADFGIARAFAPGTERLSTTIQGTADYMAPEQADPSATVDGRADVYAFAIVMYEMLSGGSLPFGDENRADIVDLISQKRKAKPKGIENVPSYVMRTIEKALNPDTGLRPRSAGDFATELIRSIRTWEQRTEERQDKRDLSGMAILAMEQKEWRAAKEYWEESLKMGDSLVARSNLTVVKRELDLQDAWAKVSEGFDKAEWRNVLIALDDIQRMDTENKKAVSRRDEAELQLKMQRLYEEGDEAFVSEDYPVAMGKFEAIYEQIPDYRDVAERLEEARKNRVKEELNRLQVLALEALVEGDLKAARLTAQDISKRAPQGEYGVESFLERFNKLSDKLEQEQKKSKTTVLNAEHRLKLQAEQITSLTDKNKKLEAQLKREHDRFVEEKSLLRKERQNNAELRQELEGRLLAYFTDLQEMVKHLDSRFYKTTTIRDYTDKLRERIRDIATRGQQLESSLVENNAELHGDIKK